MPGTSGSEPEPGDSTSGEATLRFFLGGDLEHEQISENFQVFMFSENNFSVKNLKTCATNERGNAIFRNVRRIRKRFEYKDISQTVSVRAW